MDRLGQKARAGLREAALQAKFPGLAHARWRVTSPTDGTYTCVSWAARDPERLWSADGWPDGLFYWPESAPREDTLAGWAGAFATLGYVECGSPAYERGAEKVAIYADGEGKPIHAARQLPGGLWTSKIGTMEDIEHELEALEGTAYGSVVVILSRCLGESSPP